MKRNLISSLFALASMVLISSAASAAALLHPANPILDPEVTQPLNVSFFGRPYPYGYVGWGPCVHYVQVQTRWGLAWRRIRSCAPPLGVGPVLNSRG